MYKMKKVEKLDIDPFVSKEKIDEELKIASEVSKEQLEVAADILKRQKEENFKKVLTNPSALALDTPDKTAGHARTSDLRKTTEQLLNLYLTNQFVARAINVRADTLVYKGYKIIGGDDKGKKACEELIANSGGSNLFWQLSINTDLAGDGFLEKIYNKKKTKILRLKHVHPLTLAFRKNKTTGKIIVDSKTKEPVGYTQFYSDENGVEQTKDIKKEVIEHLRYNTLGDEFTGVSTIQPGYNTIVRLMNMEYSAAEAAIKTANPLIVGTANTKSPHQIAMWGQILGKINGREQVFIPEGMKLEMLSPGQQNFNDYADYFLNAVVATFAVPKSVLLGDNDGGGNRAEQVVLTRHFYSVIRGNQKYIEELFNKIFLEYAKLNGFAAPKLVFEDIAEDAASMFKSAIELFTAGIISNAEARNMIGLEGELEAPKTGSLEGDLKKSDMQTAFPADSKGPAGSQAGVKAAQKTNSFSEVKP